MEFHELHLEKIIYEIRFESAYLFWDKSGEIMSNLTLKFPHFRLKNAQLSNVESLWAEEGIGVNFNNVKADVYQEFPESLDNFMLVTDALTSAIGDVLRIPSFTRVGVRFIWVYPAASKEDAVDLISKSTLICVDADKAKPFGSRIVERNLHLRFEDEDRGCSVRVLNATRKAEVELPRFFAVDTSRYPKTVVSVDVDCYTKLAVPRPNLKPSDFIRANRKTIAANVLGLIGI